MQAHTIYQLKEMEESLGERVAAITSQKSPFTKMMEERVRRFLQ
jgi:hypothetical protein